jgi:AcrR family transcriptional regulator
MCSAPARTTDAAVVAAARLLLQRHGPAGVTMQAVAAEVGVRAPSLYKRFADRAAILRAVETEAIGELAARLRATSGATPAEAVRGMAAAYRAFAHAAPSVYGLIFAPVEWDDAAIRLRAEAAAPLLAVAGELAGDAAALPAARLLTAFMHGWVSMELAGAFRLGGDIEAAFGFALDALIDGVRSRRNNPSV